MMEIDQGMFTVHQTVGTVLCCKCGLLMQPNAVNMCARCLNSEVDITEGLTKRANIIHCPECDRYLQPPKTWLKAQLESKELLTFCIKSLKNLNRVRLVHAEFIWTEPHSKRIKVRLVIQKEVLNGAIEQSYIVEYVVQDQMCESCSRVQANPDQWVAAVQLRQNVSHRRTLFYLEQLILKHDAAARCIKITQMKNGIDFFFANRSHAVKFLEFVGKVAPVKSRDDKQLVSHDVKSSTYNYKFTFSVQISPVCREDLISLPKEVALGLGNLGPLVICTKVTNSITLLDPLTLRYCFLNADQYWRSSFKSLLSSRQLVEYIILDVESPSSEVTIGGSRYVLADAHVARVSDIGDIFVVRTHLGHLLSPGDHALGYDLYGTNSDDIDKENYPKAVLIKKSYEEKRPRSRKLKFLPMVDGGYAKGRDHEKEMSAEYEPFLRELDEIDAWFADLDISDEETEPEDDDDMRE